MDKWGQGHVNYGATDDFRVTVVNPDQTFSAAEFSTFCDNIKSNIYLIQSNGSNLDRTQNKIGSSSDNLTLRETIHSIQQKTNQLVVLTTQYLRQASNMSRFGEKHHKLQAERLKTDFQLSVQRYSNIQKQVADKIKSVFLRPAPTQSHVEMQSPSADSDWNQESDQTQLLDYMAAQQQAQKQLDVQLEEDQAFAMERDERIRLIEADVLDVNQIFRDLATMVVDQGETINTIDNYVEKAADEVGGGVQQLTQASAYQKKYRMKLCYLFVILAVIAIVIIIVVFSVKS